MRLSPRLSQLLLAVALLLSLAPLGGVTRQAMAATTYQLSGAITGQAGAAVAGASVAALDAGGASAASATTGADGRYALAVTAGTYDIQVTPPAGSSYQISTVHEQTISGDTTLDVVLRPIGWEEVFSSSLYRGVDSFAEYQGKLYALISTWHTTSMSTRLFVTENGTNWNPVPGSPPALLGSELFVYKNRLYISLVPANKFATIYYFDGSDFTLDYTDYYRIDYPGETHFAAHQDDLYAIVSEQRIFKRLNDNNWALQASIPNRTGRDLGSFGDCLYGGFGFVGWPAELWRDCGSGWARFENYQPEVGGSPAAVNAVTQYDGKLYVGVGPHAKPASFVTEYTPTANGLLRTSTWITDSLTALYPLDNELWLASGNRTYRKISGSNWELTGEFPAGIIGRQALIRFQGSVYVGVALNSDNTVYIYRQSTTSANRAPTASAGGPYTAIIGQSLTLSGVGSDPDGDPLTYAWDLDADGSFEAPGQQVTFSAVGRLPGTQPVRLQVCDSQGACATAATSVAIVSDLRITTASSLPAALVDAPYSVTFEATGGTPPYTWSKAPGSALPAGLSLDPDSGVLSGTPTAAGEARFAIQVTDSIGATAQGEYAVDPPPPAGNAGDQYVLPITITPPGDGSSGGGSAPPTCASYALVAGELPSGMTLDASTGIISGTPSNGGDYAFTIACTTTGGQTATKSFTILISNPAPVLASLDPAQTPAASPDLTLTLTGSGFVRSSVARWNGADRPTTYVSSSELQVEISAADLATAGDVAVTVFSPAPGGGSSNALTFSVVAQPPVLTLPDAQQGQYSDPLSMTLTASDPDSPASGLAFSASGLPAGLALTDNGDGTATIAGLVDAPAGTYTAQVSVTDPHGLSDTGDLVFVIAPEDATLSYSGDAAAEAGAALTLRAQLAEADDGSPGDLARAAVLFDLADSAGAKTSYGPAAVDADGAASYALPDGLPAGDYTVTVRLDPAGGFYAAPDSAPASLSIQAPPPSGPTCGGAPATIVGTGRRDVLRGTPGDDVIVGLGGNDIIFGLGGDDLICGDDGNDVLYGGDGDDTLFGGAGNDTLRGDLTGDADAGGRRHGGVDDGDGCRGPDERRPARGGGDDTLLGEAGNDKLFGDAGHDALDGGAGKDQLDGGAGDYDQLLGGDGNDRLVDDDGVAAAHGGAGRDTLDITLRAGWRDASGQRRFAGALSGGYGDDKVTLTLLDRRALSIDITGDERDDPPSSLEGRRDQLSLRGTPATRDSRIIKFERR